MRKAMVNIRMTEIEKGRAKVEAKKKFMSLSEYVLYCIKEKQQQDGLTDSQGQFLELFDIAFKRSMDSYHKRQQVMLSKINFDNMQLLRIHNTFFKQLKIPQKKSEVIRSCQDHPILEIAKEEVLMEIRERKQTESIEELTEEWLI